jgi:hypothetical protein
MVGRNLKMTGGGVWGVKGQEDVEKTNLKILLVCVVGCTNKIPKYNFRFFSFLAYKVGCN